MERSDGKRIPLGVLYGLLGVLFAWSVAYLIPMTRDVLALVFRPAATVGMPFLVGWPDGELLSLARGLDLRSVPPLRRGDRIASIEGQPFRTPWDFSRRVQAEGIGGTLHVAVARKTPSGTDEEFVSTISLRSVADSEGSGALRALFAVVGLLMPWVCILLGFWVAFARPRDPLAWLVLFTLSGFQVAILQQQSFARWPDVLRVPAALYVAVFGSTWPL